MSHLNEIKHIEKPWGFEKIWAHTNNYVGKIIHVKKGHQLSLQYHKLKEETLLVNKGILHLVYGDNTLILNTGESIHIPPGTIHRMIAKEDDVEVIEVSTNQLDDVVRLKDDYGRSH